jgi:hypothetical protein
MTQRSAYRFIVCALVVAAALLGCVNAWWWLVLIPWVTCRLTRPLTRTRREAWMSTISPAIFLLPCFVVVWGRSHQAASFLLISVGQDRFLGGYLFPGVIEVGYYEHDPAGRKYLRDGITPEIAPFMTDGAKRFQTLGHSGQMYDFFCIDSGYCRAVPVIEGPIGTGSIYAEMLTDAWTPSSFYANSSPWSGFNYRSTHVGFPIWLAVLLAGVPFGWKVRLLRRHMRRTRQGLCRECGYDLTGNESGVCPECGVSLRRGIATGTELVTYKGG